MLVNNFKTLGLATLLWIASAGLASAATLFTFEGDCTTATCFGSTYTLVIGDANDANTQTYTATLTIDTSGYDNSVPSPAFIDAVDFKVVNSVTAFDLVTAPGGADNWDIFFNEGQAATDCGSGGGFFVCARDPNPNDLAPVGGELVWEFTFTSADEITFGHIGASYNNADGTINGQNTSIGNATTTPTTTPTNTPTTTPTTTPTIPEPASFFLVGSGLFGLVAVVRRRVRRD